MRFGILGPVEVRSETKVLEFRGACQRTLLATLLVSDGRLVLADTLIDELWGECPPYGAENALQAHVSRIRRKFEQLDRTQEVPRLASLPSGYRLRLKSDELDATEFIDTLTAIRCTPDLDPSDIVRRLRAALALWRGPALGGGMTSPTCQAAALRYEENRIAALEMLYDAEMQMGNYAGVIAELTELAGPESLNERFCSQLMVALYRAGRQTEALAAYRRMWSRLSEQLGVDPSPALQRYERAILSHDPALHRDHLALAAVAAG